MRIGSDTVAVVTGAAHGIGRAVVDELRARGARVAAIDVDAPALAAAPADSLRFSVPCDVSDEAAVQRAAAIVTQAFGPARLLIACAGVAVAGPVESLSRTQLERAMAVNYWGVVHACRAFLPALRASAASGHATGIGVVLSEFAFFSLPTKAAYAASKHAAHAFTVALAGELTGSGVQVTAVYPGATATDIVMRGEAVDPVRQAREAEFLSGGMAPAVVAVALLRGVERGRTRVLIGRDARLLAIANGIAPSLTQWAVRRWWRRVPFL